MTRTRRHVVAIAALAVIGLAGLGAAEAQEVTVSAAAEDVATAAGKEPKAVDVVIAPAPLRMLAAEAQVFLERLRREALAAKAAAGKPAGREETPAEGEGVSRVYEVEMPSVVNGSDQFQFRDVTDRSETVRPEASTQVLSLEERRAAVEAFRRAVARAKGK